jgi:two-component system, OmpR family, sensor histidine kinase MprB
VTFRTRVTLLSAAAVAAAIAVVAPVIFLTVRSELRAQVDQSLRELAERAGPEIVPITSPADERPEFVLPVPPPGIPGGYGQLIGVRGVIDRVRGTPDIPVSDRARGVALGAVAPFMEDVSADGIHLRVYTLPFGPGLALQLARPLEEIDATLRRLVLVLGGVAVLGVGAAAGLGLLVSRGALGPVRRLTGTAERVAATRDLGHRIDAGGRDELARLAGAFNEMLGALEESQRSQRQLVADASHELRTPLTSLRTNLEVLARDYDLDPAERDRMLRDAVAQAEELSVLVTDVVEVARDGEAPPASPEPVRFDEVVRSAIERAAGRTPDITFRWDVEPFTVRGVRGQLDRAVSNVLDNAVKWSPTPGDIEVTLRDGELAVRDHGPGIDREDLPHVFDRFYRSPAARGTPGSGLGLAIVKQVIESHGGTVTAENADGEGTVVRLRLPADR